MTNKKKMIIFLDNHESFLDIIKDSIDFPNDIDVRFFFTNLKLRKLLQEISYSKTKVMLFIDYNLKGKNGVTFCKEFVKDQIYKVLMTSYHKQDISGMRDANIDHYIDKTSMTLMNDINDTVKQFAGEK